MPAWNDYKKQSQERGSLAMELYMVRSIPIVEPEVLKENLPDHLAYQQVQEAAGALVMAGPLSDEPGDMMFGEGLIIYRAAGLAEATKIAAEDPMHKRGARSFEIRRWLVNEGSMSFDIKLSAQSVVVAKRNL